MRCPRAAYIRWLEVSTPVSAGATSAPPDTWVVSEPHHLLDAELGIEAHLGPIAGTADGLVQPIVTLPPGATPDLAHTVLLGALALLLRADGHRCEAGILWDPITEQRHECLVEPAHIRRAQALVAQLRALASARRRPPPLHDDPHCLHCDLAPLCLPGEVGYLTGVTDPLDAEPKAPLRPAFAQRADARPLHVGRQGAVIHKHGERLRVRADGELLAELPLPDTLAVHVYGNVMLTTQALRTCIQRDIPVAFHSQTGWFHGASQGLSRSGLDLRRAQYRAADAPTRTLDAARRCVWGKIRGQRAILRRNHPDLDRSISRRLGRLARRAERAPNLVTLRGYEGEAARLYFAHFGGLLRDPRFTFTRRSRRPPRDPVNAVLSFCYALLTQAWTTALSLVGLDPMLGFLHVPRAGRPALALDLMEETRPLLADSVVLTVFNGRRLSPDDFVEAAGAWALRASGRTVVLHAWTQRLEMEITHPLFGYRLTWRQLLEVQARLFGRWLAGELDRYPSIEVR